MTISTGMKRLVTLQVTVEIDDTDAQQLTADPGWSSHDGWHKPESGLEILSHTVCESLSIVAQQTLSTVQGRAVHTGVTISDPYETDTDPFM